MAAPASDTDGTGDARPKALVLGFSVTEPTPGYVETASSLAGAGDPFDITKLAIGGCQPKKLKFLMDAILADQSPDVVVLEIGTFGFAGTGTWESRHAQDIYAILHVLARAGVRVGMLDLPRMDHDQGGLWVHATHATICRDLGLPYLRVDLVPDWLRDVVHPTPEGTEHYARKLLQLLAQFHDPKLGRTDPDRLPRRDIDYSAAFATDVMLDPLQTEEFTRAGYRIPVAVLPEGQSVQLQVPTGWAVCGLGYITGPLAGGIVVQVGEKHRDYMCYDPWAYYARASFVEFEPADVPAIGVTQRPGQPDIALLKGEPNLDPRQGKLISILLQRPVPE